VPPARVPRHSLKMSETNLRGTHNAENVLATLATGLAWVPVSRMREAICGYCPRRTVVSLWRKSTE